MVSLVDDMAAFPKTVFSSNTRRDLFRSLNAGAVFRALGEEVRPLAYGNVLQRDSSEGHSVVRTAPSFRTTSNLRAQTA